MKKLKIYYYYLNSQDKENSMKNLAGRWWGGLHAWHWVCLHDRQFLVFLAQALPALCFSFSAVLQLDCSALRWFLPSKWIKGHQYREARGLLSLLVVRVPFSHRWLSLGYHSNGGSGATTGNTRFSLALSAFSQAGQWKGGGITAIVSTVLPAAGIFL